MDEKSEEATWFSAKVRLACLVENSGAIEYQDSVFVFTAADWAPAFERALALGYGMERTYQNMQGEQVVWRLVEVVSLDWLEASNLDGAEVYSEPVPLGPHEDIPFEWVFKPEDSEPTQTV
jgi:hypothetical protein